jgi:hypothetical protein
MFARTITPRTVAAAARLPVLAGMRLERFAAGPHPFGRDLQFVQWQRRLIF